MIFCGLCVEFFYDKTKNWLRAFENEQICFDRDCMIKLLEEQSKNRKNIE